MNECENWNICVEKKSEISVSNSATVCLCFILLLNGCDCMFVLCGPLNA